MAITLIGGGDDTFTLPEADLDFPAPLAPPPASLLWTRDKLFDLVKCDRPVARRFALSRLIHLDDDRARDTIVGCLADSDVGVVAVALVLAESLKADAVAPAIEEIVRSGSPELRETAAEALARVDSKRALELLRSGPRLDDEIALLLISGVAARWPEGTVDYLSRALNRIGLASPLRRTGIFSAVFSGLDPGLAERALAVAISDSHRDSTLESPARIALGLMNPSTKDVRREAADRQYRALRNAPRTNWSEEASEKLEDALRKGHVGQAIATIAEVVGPKKGLEVVPRPEGLLVALAKVAPSLDQLDPAIASPFLAAALSIDARVRNLETRLKARTKLLADCGFSETDGLDQIEARVRAMSDDQRDSLVASCRTALIQESFDEKLVTALMRAAPEAVFSELTRTEDSLLAHFAMTFAPRAVEALEPLVVNRLSSRATADGDLAVAIELAGILATERTAAALGRRFYELRARARSSLMNAIERSGDGRLVGALLSRAYEGEPEEAVAVGLAEIVGAPIEGKLAEIKAARNPEPSGIPIELKCSRCGEVLVYYTNRIFVDPEKEDQKPAFAGDRACKACGASDDRLTLTQQARQAVRTAMLMELAQAQRGGPQGIPIVMPVGIKVAGKRMSVLDALEQLELDIGRSGSAIRPRLKRARILILLERKAAVEDVNAVLAIDPSCPEAKLLKAQILAQEGHRAEAVRLGAEALRTVNGGNGRFYEREPYAVGGLVAAFLVSLEDLGEQIPSDIDLSEPRALMEQFARRLESEEPSGDELD
ncbi:MAG: hypothetical protein HY791_22085 [Deltaproteobacteria bacterium]|nr:hypothetical protein [Deltaproteobacteria bacterium]